MTIAQSRMAAIFNEWADRYAKDPSSFGEILGEDGKPVTDYGEYSMRYFFKIEHEMDEAGLLPQECGSCLYEAERLRETDLEHSVLAAIRACPAKAQLRHLAYGGYVIEDAGKQLGSGVSPTDAWLDAAITRQDDQVHAIRTSLLGPGCRVKVDSSSTYKGQYGTITKANGMPERWFVAIDGDENFGEVSFYAWELICITGESAATHAPGANEKPLK